MNRENLYESENKIMHFLKGQDKPDKVMSQSEMYGSKTLKDKRHLLQKL